MSHTFVSDFHTRPLLLLGAVVALALCSASPSSAQACQGSAKKGDGADIQCRIDQVLEKHDALIGTMKQKLGTCQGPNCDTLSKHFAKVEAAQGRAKRQHGRMKPTDYEDVNSRKKAKCLATNGNCYETPTDLEISDELETGAGEEVVAQLDEIGAGLDRTNELLSQPDATLPGAPALFAAAATAPMTFPPLYDYTKDGDYPAWLHISDNPKALIPTAFAMTIAAQVSEGVRRVTKNICQQDILGFNASLACLVTSLMAAAFDSTSVLLNYNLADATAWDIHGAYLRAGNLNENLVSVHGTVASVGGQVDAAQAALARLGGKFAQLQADLLATNQRLLVFQNQVIQLLLTPDGLRSVPAAILSCDGSTTECPPPSIQCSPTTGLCTFK